MTERGTSFAFQGVVTQITATMRVNSGWSGQHGLLDYSCKPSPFRAGLLTLLDVLAADFDNKEVFYLTTRCETVQL
ncbi:hypothetical protein OA07_07475 [Aphanizomenon flos-aquae 2012/KM1/D3]|nr:hypothetical protein OA07_20230 [Aphanizomenon flos-aquae 2012/KM1/D3]KHG42023.1 hypothetical protein OA07_07475 [Aphanizomenon flos-aquae 2012/KM1/D3]